MAAGIVVTVTIPIVSGLILWARGLEKRVTTVETVNVKLKSELDNKYEQLKSKDEQGIQNMEEIKVDIHEIREVINELRKETREDKKDMYDTLNKLSEGMARLAAQMELMNK